MHIYQKHQFTKQVQTNRCPLYRGNTRSDLFGLQNIESLSDNDIY